LGYGHIAVGNDLDGAASAAGGYCAQCHIAGFSNENTAAGGLCIDAGHSRVDIGVSRRTTDTAACGQADIATDEVLVTGIFTRLGIADRTAGRGDADSVATGHDPTQGDIVRRREIDRSAGRDGLVIDYQISGISSQADGSPGPGGGNRLACRQGVTGGHLDRTTGGDRLAVAQLHRVGFSNQPLWTESP